MHPYIIGFVAADGHVGRYSWLISQSHKSIDVLHKIKKFCGGYLKSQNSANSYSHELKYNLTFSKKRNFNPFEEWGIPEGNKTYTLSFPENKDVDDLWLYLRGYFEGDGCLSIEKNRSPRVQIISNCTWCAGCSIFMKNQNVECYITEDKRHPNIANVVLHSVESVRKFFDKLYKDPIPLFMDRKYYRWLEIESLCSMIKGRKKRIKLSSDDLNTIRDLLIKGKKISDLEKIYGNEPTILRINRELGGQKALIENKKVLAKKYLVDGLTVNSIHKITGISKLIIRSEFKNLKDIIPYRRGMRLSLKTKQSIIDQLKKGAPIDDIAREHKITRSTVLKIDRHLTGGIKKRNTLIRKEKGKLVKNLILKGFGRNRIHKEYGFSKKLIHEVKEEIYAGNFNGIQRVQGTDYGSRKIGRG